MQSALATSGKVLEFKKKLLEKHRLQAVLSVPDELFFNSKVGVVSCVIVFTAHKLHHNHKETYFGYYKDDGFVKRKNKGRIDAYDKWLEIKGKWLSNFINRKNEFGFGVNQIVTADMELAAETYMETDYSNLKDENFKDAILNYVTFLHSNKLLDKNHNHNNE